MDPFRKLNAAVQEIRDDFQRAMTDRILTVLHRAQVVSSYQVFGEIAGYGSDHQRDPNLHRHIESSMEDDHQAKCPFRAALVINRQNNIPGLRFFEKARKLGYKIDSGFDAERSFWEDQIRALGLDPSDLMEI
jgi:hypothetical protein